MVATATKRGGLAATKRGGRGGWRAAADERRHRRREEGDGADAMTLTISHEESWALGGGKQLNNQLTYVNERDGSGRKQCEQTKETR